MNKNFFDNLNYETDSWVTHDEVSMYDRIYKYDILFFDPKKEGVLNEQKEMYTKFKENEKQFIVDVQNAFFTYYTENYDEIESKAILPEHQKIGNASKDSVMRFTKFTSLFFDRNGNYGWICLCGFDPEGIAFLLSEEKVRVLTPSQLRDYRKIDDPAFGEMIYDEGWEKKEKKLLYGKEKLVRIATCDYKDGITDVHRASYRKYQENEARYLEEIPRVLLEYYLSMYDEIKEYWRVPRAYTKKNVTQENIMDLIDFRTLYFRYNGMFAWLCECPWEEECGIAFVLSDEKVRVELQTDIL